MPRNIANKPHPTPNPDKTHVTGPGEKPGDPAGARRPSPAAQRAPTHESTPEQPPVEEPTYDSCFDDLNLILSESIKQPDPDPNLESTGPSVRLMPHEEVPLLKQDRGKAPRTSEIFRSVVGAAADEAGPADRPATHRPEQAQPRPETATGRGPEFDEPMSDLVVVDRDQRIGELASEPEDELPETRVPWNQILLLSYSSAITLALTWMLWTGRWSRDLAPTDARDEQPALDSLPRVVEPTPAPAALPIPAENHARIGQTIRLGDLEVTPVAVISMPVELVRSIEPDNRRREEDCLVLRLKLRNASKDYAFAPLDAALTRDRGLRPSDPYIATPEGTAIRLFPLAADSEWAIVGQELRSLQPGEALETFVAAEPGSAQNVPEELSWRVRLRTGVYRTDMIAVPLSRGEIRPGEVVPRDSEY
jgi:hypothetical protein